MRLFILLCILPFSGISGEPPVVATFSIIAMDPETQEIGVAVQSKVVGVGAIVPFAKAGIGAVATQAQANVGYGHLGLLALQSGLTPQKTIDLLTREDPLAQSRQVAVINAKGEAATYTGSQCFEWAGGLTGKNYAVQGNILESREVIEAMARAFEETEGVLAERLIASLKAGQEAGGDRRGRQSAGLLVVREGWGYGGITDRFRDIRVDEHATPILELDRVYRRHRELFPRPK